MPRRSVCGAWLSVTLLLGLANAQKYRDPFDPTLSPSTQLVIGRAPGGPTLRVVLAGSTSASMQDLVHYSNLMAKPLLLNSASSIDPIDPRHVWEDLNRLLSLFFSRIEYTYSNAPANRAAADYVLTLEIMVTLGKGTGKENRVDLHGVLSRAGASQTEKLVGHGKSKVGFPATVKHFADARVAAFQEFGQSLGDSRLLAAASNPMPAPPPAVAASPVAVASAPPATTAPAQESPKKLEVRGGLYDVESKIPFNVLDSVYFDAASGRLALVGHHDDRFKGRAVIPYLQHLAALLECPKPEFSLTWTPESSRRVDALLARELTQRESDAQAVRLGAMVDSAGRITHTGALMLPALGIFPIDGNKPPGDLGLETQSINGGRVVVMRVKPGSAADKAGLKPIDFIDSVRPDRRVFFPAELERQVRFAGAGAVIEVTYERGNELYTTQATLDAAANPDPWYQVNRYDVIGRMYRAAGDTRAAELIESLGIFNAVIARKENMAGLRAYTELMHALDMDSDFEHLQAVGATSAPPYADSYNFGAKLSRQLDAIVHLAGSPVSNAYESTVRQTHDPAAGITKAFDEFDRQFVPKFKELLDPLIFRPGVGFQIPPELVEEEYHVRPEMTPDYLGVTPDSQLARLMLAADYLGKQLSNRQDLRGKIPGYQTQIEYQFTHPAAGYASNNAYRVWISVAGIDAAQSKDGKTLALREARMRFNIRRTDNQAHDLPNQQPGGYEDVLTGLYGPLEQAFSTLHELREAAKLAAVAAWMQKLDSTIRLPAEGRAAWKGPETVRGLVYVYLTVNQQHESKIVKVAEGGVSLRLPAADGANLFPVDSSVVDLRGSPGMSNVFTAPEHPTVRAAQADTGAGASPYVVGWVVPVASGTPGQSALVLAARMINPTGPAVSIAVAPARNAPPLGAMRAGIAGLPGIYLDNVEPAQAAQLANTAMNLSGPERSVVQDAALQAAQKIPALSAPSDDPFIVDYQKEAQGYDAALKQMQEAKRKVREVEGQSLAGEAAIDYARIRAESPAATDAQKQVLQKALASAQTDEAASAAARQMFDQADVRLSLVRDRASDALATVLLPVAPPPSRSRVSTAAGAAATLAPVQREPAAGGRPIASPLEACIADASNQVADGRPAPTTQELRRQLDQAKEAYRRMVDTEAHELGDRADWVKDLRKATVDISLGFIDRGLEGVAGPENHVLNTWQSGMRDEVIANHKQIRDLSALVDAEADAARVAALQDQIFKLSMRNQLLHTGLHAIRNAKTMYQAYDMGAPARDFGLWVTDSGDSLGNSGSLLNKIAPLDHARLLDLSAIVPQDQTGVAAILAAARNSGGLEDSMDGIKQLLKITFKQPGVKAWVAGLGIGTGVTEAVAAADLTIDTVYDLAVGYAGFARLMQIKTNVAQLERAKAVLAKRIELTNAKMSCYSRRN